MDEKVVKLLEIQSSILNSWSKWVTKNITVLSPVSNKVLSSVKQGNVVAAICFMLLYQILLNVLEKNQVDVVPFVHDATIVIDDKNTAQHALDVARSTLQKMGMTVNNKTKLYGFHSPCTFVSPTIAITMPIKPNMVATLGIINQHNPKGTLNTSDTQHQPAEGITTTTSENDRTTTHLSHIAPCHMSPDTTYKEGYSEAKTALNHLHNQPLTGCDSSESPEISLSC